MRVLRSRKLRALQQAYKQPWWSVALAWAAKPLTQREIGEAWTRRVSRSAPGVRFLQQDVCRIVARAVEQRLAEDPESVQHLLEPAPTSTEMGAAA